MLDNTIAVSTVKPAKTHKEQLEILKSRGLIIDDEKQAEMTLECTNYYRLRGYYIHLQKPNSDDFKDGLNFNQVITLHGFDNELRELLLGLLLDIEIVARARIAYTIAHAWGPMGYRYEFNYKEDDIERYNDLIQSIDDSLGKSRERFIKTYTEKYSGQFPIWVAIEVMSFGDLSKLYFLLPTKLKKQVADAYQKLDETPYTNWIHCCVVLRNLCAHNSRIYSRGIPTAILVEDENVVRMEKISSGRFTINPHSLFAYLLAIKRISRVSKWNDFINKYKALIDKYTGTVDLARLGFPYQWEQFLSAEADTQSYTSRLF